MIKRFVSLVLTVLVLVVPIRLVQAHSDGTAQLIGADLGTCQISAWTWPEPLVTNSPSHVSVLVTETAEAGTTGEILFDSAVTVSFVPQDGSTAELTREATHGATNEELFYEAEQTLATAGMWDVTITVADRDTACEGQASFSVPVQKKSQLSLFLWGGVAVLLLAALVFGWWQVQKRQKEG